MRSGIIALAALFVARSIACQVPDPTEDSLSVAVDRWVARGLVRYEIAGVALAIVRDGAIVHRRGFGRANLARPDIVNPDSTVFHVASVTKLVTAIAALQQVEAGRLDLRRDVRGMLGPIEADGWDAHPVSLHDLLTHTAGLDTRWIGMASQRAGEVRALADYLPAAMPAIIDRPGTVLRYSNHGYAAVGRLIEIASGLPWGAYVEQRIFAPLDMRLSYALPREPEANHAVPYRYRRDTTPEPTIQEHASPGGAMHSTAVDIARLIAALLDTTSSVPLSPGGKRLVLTPQMQVATGVPGYTYGAFEYPNARVRALSVGGEVPGFSTRVLMVPSLRLGVVVMANRKDPTLAVSVFDSLLARVASRSDTVPSCAPREERARGALREIDGAYRSNVYERRSFLRIGALLGPTLSLHGDENGVLTVVNPIDDQAGRWQRTRDSTWVAPEGQCLALMTVGGASMVALTTTFAGPLMLERVTPLSRPEFVLPVLVGAIGVLVIVVIMAGWTWRRPGVPSSGGRFASALMLAVPAVNLVFVTGFVVGLFRLAIHYDDRFAFGIPGWFTAVLLLPYLTFALTVLLAVMLIRTRRDVMDGRLRGWLTLSASAVLMVVVVGWRMLWLP